MAAASNVIPFDLLCIRQLQWLKAKGFSQKSNPFCMNKVFLVLKYFLPGLRGYHVIGEVSLQEVCDAVGWSSLHTFIRFYSLDLDYTPGCSHP